MRAEFIIRVECGGKIAVLDEPVGFKAFIYIYDFQNDFMMD